MKNYFKYFLMLFYFLIISLTLTAHSGGTDSRGGHNDRINGGYHYHHGRGPHQHSNGDCPYDDSYRNGGISIFWYVVGIGGLAYLGYYIYKQKRP